MKALLGTLIFLVATSAQADDFFCRIKSGFQREEQTAPYKVKRAQVQAGNFVCRGRLVPDSLLIEVELYNTEVGLIAKAEDRGSVTVQVSDLNEHGAGVKEAVCTCGFQ